MLDQGAWNHSTVSLKIEATGFNSDDCCYISNLYLNGIAMTESTSTGSPTTDPTTSPTTDPSSDPTSVPTFEPTSDPTIDSTTHPIADATTDPTSISVTISPIPTLSVPKIPTQSPGNDGVAQEETTGVEVVKDESKDVEEGGLERVWLFVIVSGILLVLSFVVIVILMERNKKSEAEKAVGMQRICSASVHHANNVGIANNLTAEGDVDAGDNNLNIVSKETTRGNEVDEIVNVDNYDGIESTKQAESDDDMIDVVNETRFGDEIEIVGDDDGTKGYVGEDDELMTIT